VSEASSKFVVVVATDEVAHDFSDRLARMAAGTPGTVVAHVAVEPPPASSAAAVVEVSDAQCPDRAVWSSALGVDPEVLECYRVREVLRFVRPGTEQRDGGVSFICRVFRSPGLDSAQFERHWTEVHRPLAIRHHVGMTRYVQNVVDERCFPLDGSEVAGIAELRFASLEAFASSMYDSEKGERIIGEDVAKFVGEVRNGMYRHLDEPGV
jgi:uncharacterized protein (TIGR02118 family)